MFPQSSVYFFPVSHGELEGLLHGSHFDLRAAVRDRNDFLVFWSTSGSSSSALRLAAAERNTNLLPEVYGTYNNVSIYLHTHTHVCGCT